MSFIKINEIMYPATVSGRVQDAAWDNRASKSITLKTDYATAAGLFVDGAAWSIVQQNEVPVFKQNENGELVLDENGEPIQTGVETVDTEFDNSEYSIAGDITDHRDGRITVKMGKLTELEEAYEIMLGGM